MHVLLLSNNGSETYYNKVVLERALLVKNISYEHVRYVDSFVYKDNLYYGQKLIKKPDLVLLCNTIPLHAHEMQVDAKNVKSSVDVYKLLCRWGVPTFNKIENHVRAANKQTMAEVLYNSNISTPITFPLPTDINTTLSLIHSTMKFPVVIKTVDGYAANGVILIKDEEDLAQFYKNGIPSSIPHQTQFKGRNSSSASAEKKTYVIQEYVDGSEGALYCVCVIGTTIMTTLRIGDPEKEPFLSDTRAGRVQLPIKTDDALRDLSLSTMHALGLDYARLDVIRDRNGVYKILEVNTPGGLNLPDVTFNTNTGALIVDLMLRKYS